MAIAEQEIDILNAGAVENLRIRIPEKGGVVVLLGANGAGKSTALNAVSSALGGEQDVPIRDGAVQARVNACGINLVVGKSKRRIGELEVRSMEDRLNISDLIAPPIKDKAAADARRIKALVQLSGVKADPALFYELAGGQESFQALCPPSVTETDDLVEMAGKVRRRLQGAALDFEDSAKREAMLAEGKRSFDQELDLEAPCDPTELATAHEAAVRHHTVLLTERNTATKALTRAAEAKAKLHAARMAVGGTTLEQTAEQVTAATTAHREAEAELAELHRAVDAKKRDVESAIAARRLAQQQLESIQQREKDLAGFQEAIDAAAGVAPPSRDEVDAAGDAADDARRALEQGALIRQAKARLAEADRHAQEGANLRKRADQLREAAAATDNVLSDAVGRMGCPLVVSEGVLKTDVGGGRGLEPFARLSEGQRAKIAIQLAAGIVGKGGLVVMSQEYWEGLQPANKKIIAETALEQRVVILTGQADDGELRAEAYGAG